MIERSVLVQCDKCGCEFQRVVEDCPRCYPDDDLGSRIYLSMDEIIAVVNAGDALHIAFSARRRLLRAEHLLAIQIIDRIAAKAGMPRQPK